jgi:hypothetical protein
MHNDLHYGVIYKRAISPAAAVTDNTAYVSQILDCANAEHNEFVWSAGSIADADVTFTVLLEEGDASNLSDAAAVADADLLGTEAGAAPLLGSDDKVGKLGYIGKKRYIRATITPANNSGNIFLSAIWAQSGLRVGSRSTQIV